MLAKLRSRLTYANVMATIAVFVALGGSSYAALRVGSKQIVNNSIRSKDIRNGNVTSRDIKNNDVRSGDVRNGSLLAGDFAPGQLPAGPAGPPGPTGARGGTGAPGPAGAKNVVVRIGNTSTSTAAFSTATCEPGEKATGGGGFVGTNTSYITNSYATPSAQEGLTPTAWNVGAKNPAGSTATATITAHVICASP